MWRGGGSETGGMSCMAGQHNITDAFRRGRVIDSADQQYKFKLSCVVCHKKTGK